LETNDHNFKAGDSVQLKTGGPVMTVESIDEITYPGNVQAQCTWFDAKHKRQSDYFAPCALRKAGEQTNNAIKPLKTFVDHKRIAELRMLGADKFDVSKLIGLCEELNHCLNSDCYFSMIMLTRAIIDHVPPIFGCSKFSEVANNFAGSKSFRDSMQHLENSSRKIADQHLHCQIRKSETVPTLAQVNFAPDLDVLLAEIVRLLK
jgi:uncharacterized protein YodC (DUF2158 family)